MNQIVRIEGSRLTEVRCEWQVPAMRYWRWQLGSFVSAVGLVMAILRSLDWLPGLQVPYALAGLFAVASLASAAGAWWASSGHRALWQLGLAMVGFTATFMFQAHWSWLPIAGFSNTAAAWFGRGRQGLYLWVPLTVSWVYLLLSIYISIIAIR